MRDRHPSIWSPRERFREAICNKHSLDCLFSTNKPWGERLCQPYGVKNLSTTAKFLPSPLSQCATATPTVFRGIPHHNTRLKVSQKVFLDAVTKARVIWCLILHWAARPLLESARLALQRWCLPGARACFSEMWNPFLTWPLKVRQKKWFCFDISITF